MTEETKQKAKELTKKVALDWLLIAITIETMVNYIFDYWSYISDFAGEYEAYIKIPAFALRLAVVGFKFYQENAGK